jgi:hypothetical protein
LAGVPACASVLGGRFAAAHERDDLAESAGDGDPQQENSENHRNQRCHLRIV